MLEVTASCSLRSEPGPTISVRKATWDAVQVANEMLRLAAEIQAEEATDGN